MRLGFNLRDFKTEMCRSVGAIGGVLGGGANIAGSIIAMNKQGQQDKEAVGNEQDQLSNEYSTESPYLETGAGALGQLASLYGISTPTTTGQNASTAGFGANTNGAGSTPGFTNAAGGASTANPDASFYLSPDYNFALTQGLKGVTAQGAATNGTDNGATQKAEIQYAGNLASSNYQSYASNLLNLAGLGSTAAANTNNVTANTTTALADTQFQRGTDLANGYLGTSKAIGNTVSAAASSYGT